MNGLQKEREIKEQLQKASEHGRSIFTYNVKDFVRIAKESPKHKGVILSHQFPLSRLLKALNRFFNESSAEEMEDQVRWLSDWEKDEK